jgi:hypothetical protein
MLIYCLYCRHADFSQGRPNPMVCSTIEGHTMSESDSSSSNFYRDLPAVASFAEAAAANLHTDVPRDWWVVIADVTGSTRAIEAGDYKKVNTVGVACIAAVTNVDRAIDLPFVFGGDGATFAVPGSLRDPVVIALRGAQALARSSFGLALRVGLVQVGELVDQGLWVRLARLQLSPHVTQAAFSGRGWEEAERRVKSQVAAGVTMVDERDGVAQANFDGFECRWQNVPSFNGHKLALLVAAISANAGVNLNTYQRVFEQIRSVYGEVAQYHPLHPERLKMSFNPRALSHEWLVRAGRLPLGQRLVYFARMLFQNLAGAILFARKADTHGVKWTRYRGELVQNSDFRKFDGMLRMVMDGSDEQAEQLRSYLDNEYSRGRLAFGMHKSREALVTCIVRSYNGDHVHFVDGGDGGYALAARDLKRRFSELVKA